MQADTVFSCRSQVNRFTCPTAYVKLPAPVPSNVTDGLICYTGTPNAMPVGATASLAAYTPHNITDYLDAKSAASLQFPCCFDVICQPNYLTNKLLPQLLS